MILRAYEETSLRLYDLGTSAITEPNSIGSSDNMRIAQYEIRGLVIRDYEILRDK